MTTSLTYDKTKELAQKLIDKGLVAKCYLQAKKTGTDNLDVVTEKNGELISLLKDNIPLYAYFRDISPTEFKHIESESCLFSDYATETEVRLVIYSDKEIMQSDFVLKILSALGEVEIKSLEINQYEVLAKEFPATNVFPDGLTTALLVDFIVRRHFSPDNCLTSGTCDEIKTEICMSTPPAENISILTS